MFYYLDNAEIHYSKTSKLRTILNQCFKFTNPYVVSYTIICVCVWGGGQAESLLDGGDLPVVEFIIRGSTVYIMLMITVYPHFPSLYTVQCPLCHH